MDNTWQVDNDNSVSDKVNSGCKFLQAFEHQADSNSL
jgi:hypothetical protein